jgi:hypothetical protein
MKVFRVLFAALLLTATNAAMASTMYFLGTTSDSTYDYATAANWSTAAVPTSADKATIASCNQYVTLESSNATGTLNVGGFDGANGSYWGWTAMYVRSGGALTANALNVAGYYNFGALRIGDNGSVTVNGATKIGTDGDDYSDELSVTGTGVFSTSGAITIGAGYNNTANFVNVSGGGTLKLIGSSAKLAGVGTATLDGTLAFDLSSVSAGSSWTAVDVDNLTETFGNNFGVAFTYGGSTVSATEASSGVWAASVGGIGATFTESTGVMQVTAVPEPGTLALLVAGLVGSIAYSWRKRR